jgi:hypothetical protein
MCSSPTTRARFGLDKATGGDVVADRAGRRSLTGPALQGDYVVVGDYKGYVHWLQTPMAMAALARVAATPCCPAGRRRRGAAGAERWAS